MFRKTPKNKLPTHTVRLNVTGGQEPGIVGFRIQPPINVINPDFMGEGFNFTFSDEHATYGNAKMPDEALADLSLVDKWQTIEDGLRPAFQQGLQTFLGRSGLRMELATGSGAEM